jgi:hypothetical protein
MKKRGAVPSIAIALASVLLVTVFFVACEQTKQTTSAPAVAPQAAPAEKVFVIFEGPWAFAPDPKDAGKVLAIAPKTKIHRDLYVTASNNATLASGIYDLSVPVSGGAGAATQDPNLAQAKTTAADLQRVLETKSERYVIRLPKPEAYMAASRFRSRLGPAYPPDASTEKDYVTAVSLRYRVSSLNGFSLTGSPDSGSFNPFLLQVETPTLSFVIDPAHEVDPSDKCRTHSRESFRDLTRLLKLTLYVDFPDSPSGCRDKDPQRSKTAQNGQSSWLERLAALLEKNVAEVQTAGLAPETAGVYQRFLDRGQHASIAAPHLTGATLLFFGHNPVICFAPALMLTTAP